MSDCGVPHPEHGGACTCDYPHPQHQVWFDGAWRYWPNDAYRPPAPPSSTKDNLQTIKDLSRKSMAAKMPVNRRRANLTPDVETLVRPGDPNTSHKAALSVVISVGSQNAACLVTYYKNFLAGGTGYTPWEMQAPANLVEPEAYDAHHRASDLKNTYGYLTPTGEERPGKSGKLREVLAINAEGILEARRLMAEGETGFYEKKKKSS